MRDVKFSYTPSFSSTSGDGTYAMDSWTSATPRVTSLLAAYIDSTYLQTYVSQRVEGSGYVTGESMPYVDAYAQELSRELVAFSASIWEPAQAISVQNAEQKLGSKVQVVPLALYVLAVLSYRCVGAGPPLSCR